MPFQRKIVCHVYIIIFGTTDRCKILPSATHWREDMNERQEFLRPAEVAPLLGVTTGRVYQLIGAGLIPAVRIGGSIRVPRSAWNAWLEGLSKEALESLRAAGAREDK
jgi:excisionase family DNA binding protein